MVCGGRRARPSPFPQTGSKGRGARGAGRRGALGAMGKNKNKGRPAAQFRDRARARPRGGFFTGFSGSPALQKALEYAFRSKD